MAVSRLGRFLDFYGLIPFCVVIALSAVTSNAYPDSSNTGCDTGWVRHQQNCFRVINERVFAEMAAMICRFDDSQMASISSRETLEFITNTVRPADMDRFWVGLHLQNDQYIWEDSTDAGNQSWVEKKQDSKDDDRCFYFDGEKVKPASCTLHIGAICERKAIAPEIGKCPEDTKEVSHLNLCLWVITEAMTKQQAETACVQHGGSMLDFNGLSKIGIHHLDDFLKTHTRFWTNITGNDTGVVFIDSVAGSGETDFEKSIVPIMDGEGNCTVLSYLFVNLFPVRLYRTKCDELVYVMCSSTPEKITLSTTAPPSTTADYLHRSRSSPALSSKLDCPHGYNWKEDSTTGYCYWETSYETSKISWADARAYCQSYGGDLASFHSIQEEKIGLSFQYGSMSHPYWIGLKYDDKVGDFVWTDGSSMDYTNWARGQPDHRNLRMRCVKMDATKKEWSAAYCGILSWFICKAPKQLNPKPPAPPTPKPLRPCEKTMAQGIQEYYFEGYCYEAVNLQYDWHRARTNCDNKGGDLVSVHSEAEVDFLIRLVYEDKTLFGNRVWIGLNSFGLDDQLKWSDGTFLDFVHWNKDEPNNFMNQEKCCNMYAENGVWNDENCNSVMAFICKRLNDTHIKTTTAPPAPTPAPGNCKKDWHAYKDNCYMIVGERQKDWANFSTAYDRCRGLGGTLASIRSENDQVFLTYLMHSIKQNVWIGLHDTIQSGIYFWLDNSPMTYTNWALGEPSLFGLQEDCVYMVYNSPDSGTWKDEVCEKQLPYICQARKDPSISTPPILRSTRCIQPEGWLKRGYSCFEVFNENKTWLEAVDICDSHNAELVSVHDIGVQAVVKYLSIDLQSSVWIGLLLSKERKFKWQNGWPMTMSSWDTNEPATNGLSNLCFVSSPRGYWKIEDCQEQRPFICQINAEQPPAQEGKRMTCPSTAFKSLEGDEDYCYHVGEWLEGFNSYFQCFLKGGNLVSIHSQEQLNALKNFLIPTNISGFFIGLSRNKKSGFAWADNTAVDFENWASGEPQGTSNMCVEMKAPTFKWRVVSCTMKRSAVCSLRKEPDTNTSDDTPEEGITAGQRSETKVSEVHYAGVSSGGIAAIVVSMLVAIVVVAAAVYFYFKLPNRGHFRLGASQSLNFENEMYEAEATLELREEQTTSLVED